MQKNDGEQAWDVIQQSIELSKMGEMRQALELLDEFLAKASSNNWKDAIRLVAGTAAVMADTAGNPELVRRYHEQLLTYFPEDTQALYGIARALHKQGETDLAKEYATKCYELSIRRKSELDLSI